jgi:hypothetical protein
MSTVIEETRRPTHNRDPSPTERVRATMAAMRLSFTWFGTRKTLSSEQKAQAAETFGAAGPFLSAGKKLLDTGHPRFKAVSAVRRQATAYFQGMSLPYPEPAVRLIRQTDLESLQRGMTDFQEELSLAVEALDEAFQELKETARAKLGRLYSEGDYPHSLRGLFEVSWDFPSVEPPDYLRRLSPSLYQQECQRVTARFDEAVQLAETMFIEELGVLVSHLAERLAGQSDGKPKVFRDSAIENLDDFFQRFGRLNVCSSAELDDLVQQARDVVGGVGAQQLRDSASLRRQVRSELSQVQVALDQLMIERPRRNILRRAKA